MVSKNILLKLISLCLVFPLYSCGQTGDLYLPEEREENKIRVIEDEDRALNATN